MIAFGLRLRPATALLEITLAFYVHLSVACLVQIAGIGALSVRVLRSKTGGLGKID
jgi:hypothetical protein